MLFFTIATLLSNIFRFDVFSVKESLKSIPNWLYIVVMTLLEGSGILVGTIIGLKLLHQRKTIAASIFGSSFGYSALMMVIPVILFLVFGVNNNFNMNKHVYGLLVIVCTLLYCIIEEYGWRGYLQEELQDLKPWKKYTLIGFMWYIWHLPFLSETSLMSNLLFLAGLILGSWGIGQVVISTRSVSASACFHLIIQILLYNSLIKNGINQNQKVIIIIVCVVLWVFILKKWEKEDKLKASKQRI